MYAWIEEVAGNNSDAELIFSKFIYRYPGQYACWHAYALSALAFKGPTMAINVLLQSAAQFLLTTPEPGEVISAKTARSIFRTLLRLPTSEEQPALILPQTSTGEPESNPYLWQNYCLMEALDSPSTAKFAFDAALANITARWDRILIWEQYISVLKNLEGYSEVKTTVELLSRCFTDVGSPPLASNLKNLHPYSKKILCDARPSSLLQNSMLAYALAGLNQTQWGATQRALTHAAPGNTYLSLMAAQFELGRRNVEAARALLEGALRDNPACEALWLNVARMQLREGNPAGACQVFQKAVQIHPTSSLLWANWIASYRAETSSAISRQKEAEKHGVFLSGPSL